MTSAYIGEEIASKIKGKPKTNFDLLKEKSVEKMAEFLEMEIDKPWCTPAWVPCKYKDDPERYGQCHLCALEWLKKEVSE